MKYFNLAMAGMMLSVCVAHGRTAGWRTDGTGLYPSARPPTEWEGSAHLIWKTAAGSWSNASPVVVGDRVFVLGEPTTLLCLDREMGQIRWQESNDYGAVLDTDAIKALATHLENQKPALEQELRELKQKIKAFEVSNERSKRKSRRMKSQAKRLLERIEGGDPFAMPRAHPDNGYSSATPISDGKHVWAVFGTGMVVCYDKDGQRVWARLVQKPKHGWGHSASPKIIDGKLIVSMNDLFALDPQTGETLWQTDSETHWGTPAVTHIGKAAVIITTAGQIVLASDGAVLADGLPNMQWNGPLVVGRNVYFIEDKASAYELPADISKPLDLNLKELWRTRVAGSRHYASPVVHDSLVYTISREATMSALDAQTGHLVYKQKMELGGGGPNSVYTSISLAGGLLYAGSIEGEFVVFRPGRVYEEVSRVRLERLRSTPVFSGKRVYVRGLEHVYCLGPANPPTASE